MRVDYSLDGGMKRAENVLSFEFTDGILSLTGSTKETLRVTGVKSVKCLHDTEPKDPITISPFLNAQQGQGNAEWSKRTEQHENQQREGNTQQQGQLQQQGANMAR